MSVETSLCSFAEYLYFWCPRNEDFVGCMPVRFNYLLKETIVNILRLLVESLRTVSVP